MSSDPSPIRILAVDDHPLFRQGIAALVAGQPDMILVSEAANGREAIQRSLNAVTSDQLQSDWERKTAFPENYDCTSKADESPIALASLP